MRPKRIATVSLFLSLLYIAVTAVYAVAQTRPAAAIENKSMKILYTAKDSLFGQVDLGVAKPDFSVYDSIFVRAYFNGTSTYDSAGATKYGYLSLSLVTMSDNWTWREATLGTLTFNTWKTYAVAIGTDPLDSMALLPADPTTVDFFALQAYSKGYHGTIYLDWIAFSSNGGTSDTVYTFNVSIPMSGEGNVMDISSILTDSVTTDQEWKTATSGPPIGVVHQAAPATPAPLTAYSVQGKIMVALPNSGSGETRIRLSDLQGKTVFAPICFCI